jgi:hypothetical protein
VPGTNERVKKSKKAPALHSKPPPRAPAGPAVERQRREAVGQAVAGSNNVECLTGGEREAVHQTEVEFARQRRRAVDDQLTVFGSRLRPAEFDGG